MGLLSLGTPLDWHESKKLNEHVRANGIEQLINIFAQHAHRRGDRYLWGDEVEYMLVDMAAQTARLAIDHDHILLDLNDAEAHPQLAARVAAANVSFHPEYGRYMLEATPLRPYDGAVLADYVYVEANMAARRVIAQLQLPRHVVPLTLTLFPRMGCGVFTLPPAKAIGPALQLLFLPDEIINRHARFPTLTANIRKRRGCKVAINLPLYPDRDTKLVDALIAAAARNMFPSDAEAALGAARPGHVYMDLMGFGMGLSCLQVTMQARDIAEARYLYDALAPLTPVLLALTAAAPIFKGHLVNQDVRWNVILGAVDDRTFVERGEEPYRRGAACGRRAHADEGEPDSYDAFGGLDVSPSAKRHMLALGGGVGLNGDRVVNARGDTALTTLDGEPIRRLPKLRYDSIDHFLGANEHFSAAYNDLALPLNGEVYERLRAAAFDHELAQHFAHLFVRDPLVIFLERVNQDNRVENDHFENIQLTNWQTLRFKPPALYADAAADAAASAAASESTDVATAKAVGETPSAPSAAQTDGASAPSAAQTGGPTAADAASLADTPGWRVEFRPMEIQLTDFENAAYSAFISLLLAALLQFRPNLYIPISKIDVNMATAHRVDAAVNDKFWFRNPACWRLHPRDFVGYDLLWFDRFCTLGNDELGDNVYVNGYLLAADANGHGAAATATPPPADEVSKLCSDAIVNGADGYPGMIHLVVRHIATTLVPLHHHASPELALQMVRIQHYLKLVSYRAAGRVPTIAHWLRHHATTSALYHRDLCVSDALNYQLVAKCHRVSQGLGLREYLGEEIGRYVETHTRPSEA